LKLRFDPFFIFALALPFVPVFLALCYGIFCVVSVQQQQSKVELMKSQMAMPIMHRMAYFNFMSLYPQQLSFDLNTFCSDRHFGESLMNKDIVNSYGPWSQLVEELKGQKIYFETKKTVTKMPYHYLEHALEKPIKCSKEDLIWFIQKIENTTFDQKQELGCGEINFTNFCVTKRRSILGDYFVVDASVVEKKGGV
jgi:hypothetical protein